MSLPGQRFKRIPHASSVHSTALDPALNGNLDQWPHLRILVQCYKTDWLKDEGKYGCYGSIQRSSFQSQIFEGPDTDVETEIHLANLHQARNDDCPDDEEPTTSGRQSNKKDLAGSHCRWLPKHLGPSPLHAYEPAFNWESERATIFGQRMQELHASTYQSGLKVAVKVISLKLQAGFVEPIYGTLSLYHRERREKLSEDFSFQFLPGENSEETLVLHRRAIFSLDSISPSVYMLIQLEKHATEEGGIKSSVYSRKEPVHLTEKEKQRLQVWARIMPFREPFAWAVVPLFEMNIGNGIPGISSPSSPRGAGSTDILDADGRSLSGNRHVQDCFNSPVIIEIPGLNRVKDCYNEDWLQDPKKKIHKPVKATLRLEVERISTEEIEVENSSNASSPSNPPDHVNYDGISAENSSGISSRLNNGHAKRGNGDQMHLPKTVVSGSEQQGISEGNISDFRALDFRLFTRNEPFTQLVHCLYVYPQSVSLSRKRNLFIRVQFKDDDVNIHKQGLEAIYAKDPSVGLQSYVHSQIAVSARTSYFHDEFKIRLPAVSTTQHHILFTFFHVDLHMKLEAPKPTIIGYAFLPISLGSQALRLSDGSLPIVKELLPHYLQDNMKDKLEYVEDGRTIFKLRLRLCSSIYPMNERVHDFFDEFDRHSLRTSPPWGSELLEAINSLKNVDSTSMTQFLYPFLNMLLYLIGDSGETLQVAAFRAMVAILTRVQQESYRAQQESSDSAERNAYLVQYVDYVFDDFNGEQAPVYPGLCNVWRGLARSKAKGYRVGPVYDDVLSMAWVFLELIVKSAALEQARAFSDNLPLGEDVPPLQLTDDVFRCILNLYDCLLTEVHERCKKGLSLARRLNSSLAFFCYDLLSVIDPRQVFELVALYFDKFTGVCPSTLHDCKLTFLQIVCDHDLFIEMPGRDPSERNYLASVLMQEVFLTWDHDDLAQRARAARILVILMCKHEFDIRYQKIEDKLYISQLYFQLIGLILDEIPVFYNLSPTEKREVLVCVLQIVRHLDDVSLIKAWQQSVARTRLFFKLMEECLVLFEHKKTLDSSLISGAARSPDGEAAYSPKYSDKLSPAVNLFLADASRQELKWMQPQATPDNGHIWKKLSPQLTSPNQPYSLREALAQAQSSRKGASNRALRESLHPLLRQKLEVWEENLSAAVSLQVLEIAEKFTHVAAVHSIATDYVKLDCVTAIFTGFLSRSQPLTFWNAFVPVFNNLFSRHGATLMGRENDRFLKQIAFHLLQLAVFRNESIRRKAVVSLQILVRCSFYHFHGTARLCVMLTITLSELMSEVQVTQMRSDGNLEESGEACRLRKSLEEMASEECSRDLLRECALDDGCLNSQSGEMQGSSWQWSEVHKLSSTLLRALDASVEHALLSPTMVLDKYAAAESYHSLAWAYAHVPDLHIMWLLHLCDAHQEMQSWAEAAQCAVAVAGVIMQALVVRKDAIWAKEHVEALRKICPMLTAANAEASAAEVEGYGASKLTVDSAVKYLQLANKLFAQAELFHFCAAILELIIPVHKNRRAYGQLAKCHTSLTSIYDSILEQESNPLPFIDATYYRVGFYGKRFGKLNRKEYVYREARDIRLGDIMEKLGHIYESKVNGDHTLHIIPDSRQVNADELQSGVCYLQITSVDPVLDEEELESRRERVAGQIPNYSCARVFNQFLYDTPFTKNGKTQGGLEDQWKRRTALQTEGSFPALVSRLLVVKSESREFSPIENAIGMIETRTVALRNELEEPRSSDGDHLPRLQSLQRILQGSVAVQVNSGVLGVCTAFLSGEPATKLKSQELQQLIAALLEFMAVCKRAIRVHSRLIGEEDQDFHSQLVNGFQSLTAELSHYIPAILSEL